MKIRWTALAVAAILAFSWPVFGETIDLIVMVDTSESMFPYFDDLVRYLMRDILESRLHSGDTFHLLSFSGTPESEIALEIGDKESAQQAFYRVRLLQPFGRYTDLVAALQFLYRYVMELPEKNRKEILLLTDGVHDPPPESPNRTAREEVQKELERVSTAIKREGWNVHILKYPVGADTVSFLPEIGQAMNVPVVPYRDGEQNLTGTTTGFPSLTFPGDLGHVGRRFSVPFVVHNYRDVPILARLIGIEYGKAQILDRPADVTVPAGGEETLTVNCRLPVAFSPGEYRCDVKLTFDGDLRISPTEGTLVFFYKGLGRLSLDLTTLFTILYILAGLAAAALLVRFFLYMRHKLHETSFETVFRSASSAAFQEAEERNAAVSASGPRRTSKVALMGDGQGRSARKAGRQASVPLMGDGADTGASPRRPGRQMGIPLMDARFDRPRHQLSTVGAPTGRPIEMRVADQNHRIGLRNVHRIAPGTSRTVGGGFSPFLVFLYPVPAGIAELRNDGSQYVFRPLKPEYFPDISGSIPDCLDTEIQAVTPRGKRVSLQFREYVSTLDEINDLMLSIRMKIPTIPMGN